MCARAAAGFRCHPSQGTGFGNAVVVDDMADAVGWDDANNYATIRMGDINGDGLADVCARANAGIRCWPSNKTSFGSSIVGPELSDANGFDDIQYYSTIRLADVTGDGKDDLCVRGPNGVKCYASNGTGFGAGFDGPALTDGSGWNGIDHYGTLRTGDVNGDGKMDLCARAAAGMKCWLSSGTGFPTAIDGPAWSDANGWTAPRYWSTIQLVDISGDGKADLCARASKGIVCHVSDGAGFGPEIEGPAFADSSGWADQSNYLTMRMADIDGDGKADVCLRANAGIVCHKSTGAGFGPSIDGPDLSDASGWWQEKYFRTLRLADIDGDGKADLCGRDSERMRCWKSLGTGFSSQMDGPAWADSVGWGGRPYYSTIRAAGPKKIVEPPPEDAGAGGAAGSPPDASATGGAGPDASAGGANAGGANAGGTGTGGASADASAGDGGSGVDAGGGGFSDDGASEGGCGCSVPGRGGSGLIAALVMLGLGLRRRVRS